MRKPSSVRPSCGVRATTLTLARPQSPEMFRQLKAKPPDAVVIDLTRLPSHGRDVAMGLRVTKATRHVPIVFVEGAPDKVERVRQLLPDAVYTTWKGIGNSLKRAIAQPPTDPVVPGSSLAGYSGTPLPRKLGIKAGYVVALLGAPEDFSTTLGKLPEGVVLRQRPRGRCDLTIWFASSRKELERRVQRLGDSAGEGGLWIAWRKTASGVKTDVNQAIVRQVGLAAGLVDYKICAIDATWSALRFARAEKSVSVLRRTCSFIRFARRAVSANRPSISRSRGSLAVRKTCRF